MTCSLEDHLTDEELLQHVEGHSNERIGEHLAFCTVCRSLSERMAELCEEIRSEEGPSLSAALRQRVMARYRRTYGARPLILRLLAYRIPLYQVAAAVAVLVALTLAPRPRIGAPAGSPPLVAAASDLWGPPPARAVPAQEGASASPVTRADPRRATRRTR